MGNFIKNLKNEEDIKVVKFLCRDFYVELKPKNFLLGITRQELLDAAL